MIDKNINAEKQSGESPEISNEFYDTNKLEAKIQEKDEMLTIKYVLEQINRIATQTEYLDNTIDKLGKMTDGNNAEAYSPGNTIGQAKAEALGDVVRSRETTNQQLLRFYEKMYDDLKPKQQKTDDQIIYKLIDAISELPPGDAREILSTQLNRIL